MAQEVVLLQYSGGNTQSVLFALHRLGVSAVVTDDPDRVSQADRVIIPGVGSARSAMEYLRERELDKLIRSLKQPVLGICLGQQLLCETSEEEDCDCLGIIPAPVKLFRVPFKVPHMGWNSIFDLRSPLFVGVPSGSFVYFVHSYYVPVIDGTIATSEYGHPFSAAVQWKNFIAVQYHPERSGEVGAQVLQNFLRMESVC